MSQFQQPIIKSAVPAQATQQIASAGQMQLQQQQQNQQAAIAKERNELARREQDISRELALAGQQTQLAQSAGELQSQAAYRDMKASQFQQDMEFKKAQYQQMLDMEEAKIKAQIAQARGEFLSAEEHDLKIAKLNEQINARALALSEAQTIMDGKESDLAKNRDLAATEIDKRIALIETALSGMDVELSKTFSVSEFLQNPETFGMDPDVRDSLMEGLGDLARGVRQIGPDAWFSDDPTTWQAQVLRRLAKDEDWYDPMTEGFGGMGGPAMGIANLLGFDPQSDVSFDAAKALNRKSAITIANNLPMVADAGARGAIQQALEDAFSASTGDASAVKAARAQLQQVASANGISMDVIDGAVSKLAKDIKMRERAFSVVASDYDRTGDPQGTMMVQMGTTTDGMPIETEVNNFDAWVGRKMFNQDTARGIYSLSALGTTTDQMEATALMLRGADTTADQFETLLGQEMHSNILGGRGQDLIDLIDDFQLSEDQVEGLVRNMQTSGLMDENLRERFGVQADAGSARAQLAGLEELLKAYQ